MNDLISRQAAMEEISKQQTYKMFEGEDTLYLDANDVGSVLASLPSAQPDMSEYSDKLWKAAYERGKAEAQPDLDEVYAHAETEAEARYHAEIVRCKDCRYRDPEDHKCDCGHDIIWQLPRDDKWYCADAERRTDEADYRKE